MKLNVDKIYVCHWDKLVDRKEKLIEQLDAFKIDEFQMVEHFDVESFDYDDINTNYPLLLRKNLKKSEMSLIFKHLWIIKNIHECGYNSSLVFEDDIILEPDFTKRFNEYTNQLPIDWDICWVGSCCNLNARNIEDNKFIYKIDGSRCTHAYMISNRGVSKIMDKLSFVDNTIDWYFNKLISENHLNNFWMEPPLVFQNNSEFKTSLIS